MQPLDPFYPASRRTLIGETCRFSSTVLKNPSGKDVPIRRGSDASARSRWMRSLSLLTVGFVMGACGVGHAKWGYPVTAASGVASAAVSRPGVATAAAVEVGRLEVGCVEGSRPAADRQKTRRVIVRSGDTLWTLAERYGNPDRPVGDNIDDLLSLNHLGPDATLIPGQAIEVPKN